MSRLSIEEMKRLNHSIGHYFFDKETMEFWGSKIESELIGDLFVTSEDNYNRTEKLYTVRRFNMDTYEVETFSGFQQFKTLKDALAFINEVA